MSVELLDKCACRGGWIVVVKSVEQESEDSHRDRLITYYIAWDREERDWSLLTAERIWFKCDLYLRFIPPINLWKVCIDLRPFSKYFNEPFSRTLRSPRSNNLEIQNDENSKWKLVKTRWNPNFGLGDLENDLLTSTTSEGAQWIFSKNTFLKSVDEAEKNEL